MTRTALVVGASGIVGSATTELLVKEGWTVHGLARRPTVQVGVHPVAADLRDEGDTAAALAKITPDAVFITTWARQESEAENIRVNSAMVRNLLDALRPAEAARHVALVTGLKHYLGPFEAYGRGVLPQTPFREEQGRLDIENFYYAQEDGLFAAAERDGFSLERAPSAHGDWKGGRQRDEHGHDAGRLCNHLSRTGRPFRLSGIDAAVESLTDMTDARLLARHLSWADTPACPQRGLQRRERRRVPLEVDVGRASRTTSASHRLRSTALCSRSSSRWRVTRKYGGRSRRAKTSPAGSRPPRIPLAHRCRSWAPDRGRDRHVQKPPPRIRGVSAYRQIIHGPLRTSAR